MGNPHVSPPQVFVVEEACGSTFPTLVEAASTVRLAVESQLDAAKTALAEAASKASTRRDMWAARRVAINKLVHAAQDADADVAAVPLVIRPELTGRVAFKRDTRHAWETYLLDGDVRARVRACLLLLFLFFAHTPPQVVPAPDSSAKVKENVSKAFLNARPRVALGSHNGLVRGSATHDGRDPTAAASADGVPAHLSLLARGAEQRLFNQRGVRTSTLPPFPAPVPEEPFDVAMAQLCRKPAFRK